MAEAAGAPATDGAAPAPRVMLLSLWIGPGQAWHARLVTPDAAVHDFSSPFELARFVARAPQQEPATADHALK